MSMATVLVSHSKYRCKFYGVSLQGVQHRMVLVVVFCIFEIIFGLVVAMSDLVLRLYFTILKC